MINKIIGEDLTAKMNAKGISDYYIHTTLKACTQPTLAKIKKGTGSKSLSLRKVIDVYKAIGEDCININKPNFKLYVSF